jgi:hypothetical protein
LKDDSNDDRVTITCELFATSKSSVMVQAVWLKGFSRCNPLKYQQMTLLLKQLFVTSNKGRDIIF